MSKMGMGCGIADVCHSEFEEYFSFFPLHVFISSSLFSENRNVCLLMRSDHLGLHFAESSTVSWL